MRHYLVRSSGFCPALEFLDECIFAPTKVEGMKGAWKGRWCWSKKGNSLPRFWQTGHLFDGSDSAANWTEWRSAAAAPEWFGSGLITQADDSSDNWSDNSIELMMFGDFLRCPWPTYLLHLTLNQCWMTSPATPNHAVGFQLTRCWVLLSHSDWGSRYWIW